MTRKASIDKKDRQTFFSAIDTGQSVDTNAILVELGWRRDMALIGVLKSLNVDNLSDAEKKDLKKRLQKHKKELSDTAKIVDRHLKNLAAKKKRKAGKKKRA